MSAEGLLREPGFGGVAAGESAGVGVAQRGDVEVFEQREGFVDGVDDFGGADSVRVGEPGAFAGVARANADGGSCCPCEQAASGETLAVEDEVVIWLSEGAEVGAEGGDVEGFEPAREVVARKDDDVAEGGVTGDDGGEDIAHEPVDAGLWVGGAQAGEDGDTAGDIAQRAGADDEDA